MTGTGAKKAKRNSRWRHPLWLALGLAGVVLFAVVIFLATLRWAAPRQAVLKRIVPEVERRLNLDVEVGDFGVRVWSTGLELEDITLAHPRSRPFLRGDRARLSLALLPLLAGRIEIRSLDADGLDLDLDQLDLERLSSAGESDEGGSEALRVGELDLGLASVRGLPLPAGLGPWVSGWRLQGGRIVGGLGAGVMELSASDVGLVLERLDGAPEVGRLSGRMVRNAAGDIEVPEAILAGRGVDVRVFGRAGGGPDAAQHWQGRFDIDPTALFALPGGGGGRVRGRGELSLPGRMARLELELADVPAEIVRPWLEDELFEVAGGPGTRIDLVGELAYASDASEPVLSADAELVWRRGADELVRADLHSPVGDGGEEGHRARLSAALRPEMAGARVVVADLVLSPGGAPADLRVENGEVKIDAPDLQVLWADLARYWPALLAGEAPPQLVGALSADIALVGPVGELTAEGGLEWSPDENARVGLTFAGQPASLRLSGDLELAELDPALFGFPVGGRVDGSGVWQWTPTGVSGSFDLESHLHTSPVGLDAAGRLGASFADGALDLDLSDLALGGVRGRFGARIPIASLGPLVSDGPLAGPALEPIHLDWDLAEGSAWDRLVTALTGEPAGFELTSGARGELELDPRYPAASAGRLTLVSLSATAGGVRIQGPEELVLRADRGLLEVMPAELGIGAETLVVEGRVGLDPIWRPDEPVAAVVANLDMSLHGSVPMSSLVGELEPGFYGGTLELDLSVTGGPPLPAVDLALSGNGAYLTLGGERRIRLAEPELSLAVRPEGVSEILARWTVDDGPARFTGRVPADDPWLGSEALLELDRPLAEIDRLSLPLGFEGGSLVSRGAELDAVGVVSTLDLVVPLATLARWAETKLYTVPLPADAAAGPMTLAWHAGRSDWGRLLAALGVEEPPMLEAGVSLELEVDPTELLRARGELLVSDLGAIVEGREIGSEAPLRLTLADKTLVLEPGRLMVDGVGLELGGSMELSEAWVPGDPPTALVGYLEGRVEGDLPAKLLNPFLAGGRAEGLLSVKLDARGTPETLEGELVLHGPEATVAFLAPYATRIRDLDLDVRIREGVAEIRRGGLELNEGRVEVTGTAGLEDGVALRAALEGARYRLDYGLITELSGDLALEVPAGAENGRLSGKVVVERGWLNRPVRVHSELLAEILSPVDLTGTEGSMLDRLELDLELVQREGVRVDNNLADLWVRWEPLEITGTATAPAIEGRVDTDPGGLVFLFGQTVRLDRAVLSYSGQPGAAPTLDLETTTSLDDPSIGRLEGLDPLTASSSTPSTAQDKGAALAAGVAGYYGEEIATRIARSLGASRFSVRPVLVFGEVDPSARLNIGTDVSPSVTLAASLDLRSAERQTYLLDVHEIPGLPSFKGQVFTTDRGSEGATAQQQLEFGGTPAGRIDGPRIRAIETERPPGVSARAIRNATGFAKGQRLPEWGTFAAEVELEAFLRGAGYPDARVEVEAEPVAADRVDLAVAIVHGPRVEFAFEGVKLPKRLRESVSELYRTDFFEEASLLEMERQAVLALRSQGHLGATARVEVGSSPDAAKGLDRRVTVVTDAGRRTSLEDLVLEGLPSAATERAVARFPSLLQRVELAEGVAAADLRLVRTLAGLGWPDAAIVGRSVSEDGDSLTMVLDPGVRLRLAEIRLVTPDGAPWSRADPALAPVGLLPGDPLSSDRLASAAIGLEVALMDQGYDEAKVAASLVPREEGGYEVDVVFTIDPGERRRFGEARFAGLHSARESWARSRADLSPGAPVQREEIFAARRRLYESGRFTSVVSSQEPTGVEDEVDVVFDVRERARFRLAYGLRWDSDQGGSAVVDLVDQSFLRRGLSLGGRVLYSANDKSLRLNATWPFLLFNKGTLEIFALGRRELDDGLIFDALESTVQFGYPLGESDTVRVYTRYRDVHIYEEEPDPFFPIDLSVRNPFVGFQWIRDRRNAPESTTRGLFSSADLSVSDDFLGSDLSYARFFGQVNLYRPAGRLLGRSLTWAQSYRVGYASAFKGQELRLEDRLYAGGEYSVRGYPRESLGPPGKDSPFLKVSEDALFVMNQELRFDIWDPVAGLFFLDMGNTWTGTTGYDFDLFKSVGFGVRARTPVGLMRLDLAFPLDRREIDPAYKIYLGFGSVF